MSYKEKDFEAEAIERVSILEENGVKFLSNVKQDL
jgi:hypothetical protein